MFPKKLLGIRMLLWFLLTFALGSALRTDVPPEPKYKISRPSRKLSSAGKTSSSDMQNPWEKGELFESDIMVPEDDGDRNGLEDTELRWPNATLVYFVDEDFFSPRQLKHIKAAMVEIERETCVRFRPYRTGDTAFLRIRGNSDAGCASFMGRLSGGQELNLEPPDCIEGHGTVLHELLHALGFAHQHSAPDRDKYIKIIWDNIAKGKARNFEKRDDLTDFDVGYDYNSIMHYSAFAGSRNKEPTIVPLDKKAKIGQRKSLSKGDIQKLRKMYGCPQKIDKKDKNKNKQKLNVRRIHYNVARLMKRIHQ